MPSLAVFLCSRIYTLSVTGGILALGIRYFSGQEEGDALESRASGAEAEPDSAISQPTDASVKKLTVQENHRLMYEALTNRSQDGMMLLEDPDFYEADVIEKWERRTSKLVAAALDQDEGTTSLIDD